jgi:hypothetical protein
MRIEILIKFFNDSYDDFEFRINKTIRELEKDYKEIIDTEILNDGKQIVAIIKYK